MHGHKWKSVPNVHLLQQEIAEVMALEIEENTQEIEKIINRLYDKYMNKYDLYTTKNKIRQYLYSKGYANIDIDEYIKRTWLFSSPLLMNYYLYFHKY